MNILHHYGTVHAQDAKKLRRWGLQMRGIMAQASALGQISSSKEMLAFGKNRYITTSVKACAIDLIRDSEEDPQLRIGVLECDGTSTLFLMSQSHLFIPGFCGTA